MLKLSMLCNYFLNPIKTIDYTYSGRQMLDNIYTVIIYKSLNTNSTKGTLLQGYLKILKHPFQNIQLKVRKCC